MKSISLVAIFALTFLGCSASQQSAAVNIGEVLLKAGCQVLVTVENQPDYAPLCTTLDAVAQAYAALSKSPDAGGQSLVAAVALKPSEVDVYNYLKAHGAVVLGG